MIIPGIVASRFPGELTDPHWENVILLMHMDGPDNGTNFVDETGLAVTRTGDIRTKTDNFKFGISSGLFGATGSYLSVSPSRFDFGINPFTMEALIYLTETIGGNLIACNTGNNLSSAFGLYIQHNTMVLDWIDISNVYRSIGFFHDTPLNEWVHVAMCMETDGTATGFFDGTPVAGTASRISAIKAAPSNVTIGGSMHTSNPRPFNGYIDDIRVTKGVARYSGPFTPPKKPFPHG